MEASHMRRRMEASPALNVGGVTGSTALGDRFLSLGWSVDRPYGSPLDGSHADELIALEEARAEVAHMQRTVQEGDRLAPCRARRRHLLKRLRIPPAD